MLNASKDKIKEPSYIECKACWWNHLDAALEKYKDRAHHAIRMTPFEANNKLIPNVLPNLMPSNTFPKFQAANN